MRDEHNRILALFVQKTQTGVDDFKLHNMASDPKKSDLIGRIEWSTQLSPYGKKNSATYYAV